jgi:hypothetical protein
MKRINKILAFGIIAAIFFAACKKSDTSPVLTPQEKILTNKIWKLQSLTVPKSDDATKDSSITKSCSDSALMAFDVYKAFQLADPTKECDSTILAYDAGKWSLSASNDTLFLNGNKRKLAWKLNVLNDSTLKATFRDSISPTNNWIKTITLK